MESKKPAIKRQSSGNFNRTLISFGILLVAILGFYIYGQRPEPPASLVYVESTAQTRVRYLQWSDMILRPELVWLRIKAAWTFYSATGIMPGQGQCLHKRAVLDNLMTDEECSLIRSLMDYSVMEEDEFADTMGRKNIYQLESEYRRYYRNHSEYKQARDTFWKVRTRMLHLSRTYFQKPTIYPDSTLMTKREASQTDYSHGVHSDNCFYDFETGACTTMPAARGLMLVLFEDGFSGGRIALNKAPFPVEESDGCMHGTSPEDKVLYIEPKCGRAVLFTSGPENLHSVEKVHYGARYAVTQWMTRDPEHWE